MFLDMIAVVRCSNPPPKRPIFRQLLSSLYYNSVIIDLRLATLLVQKPGLRFKILDEVILHSCVVVKLH